jgi:glycosyltransferase involved in cell wall biosynthesis
MLNGKVSLTVVITNYNKGILVLAACDSVLSQKHESDELIIIDDCSSCEVSKSSINLLSKKGCNIFINGSNSGVSYSKNRGVNLSNNDCIVLLDSDDILPANALSNIRAAFTNNPNSWLVFGDYLKKTIGGREEVVSCQVISTLEKGLDSYSLANNWILLGTSPFRRSKCFNITSFDSRFNRTDDVDFHRRLITNETFSATYVKSVIYQWNVEVGGNNHNIPHRDILMSHLSGFIFFYKYLSKIKYIMFISKLILRLLYLSFEKLFKRKL